MNRLVPSMHRAGNEPRRARLGSARFGSVVQRAKPGSARQFHEPIEEARLGSLSARELARAGSRATQPIALQSSFCRKNANDIG